MTQATDAFFDLDTAPLSVARVTLIVNDLDRMNSFYTDRIGLRVHAAADKETVLGAGAPFLRLLHNPDAKPRDPRAPGLFHTAFLLPTRKDLASWLNEATEAGQALLGAADHNVSEAIYLNDPEGNGIEVYADRSVTGWHGARGSLYMPSRPLDLTTLPEPGKWTGAPEATRVGHVHLQTPQIDAAEAFWTSLGMDVMARYPGASFFGSGGYHHQIAANTWRSRGRPVEPSPKTGLAGVTLAAGQPAADPAQRRAPSGVTITIEPKRT